MVKLKWFISLLVCFTLVLTACGSTQTTTTSNTEGPQQGGSEKTNTESSEPILIKMADHLPTGHFLQDIARGFQERAAELSGGKIKFEYYPAAQLGEINELAGLTKQGVVDLGYSFPASAGFLPLSTVAALPSLSSNATDGGAVFEQLLNGVLAEEWEKNKLKPIYSFITPPNDIFTSKSKVASMEDLQRMKIRVPGGISSQIPNMIGATPVSINVTEIYEGMQKGVVEGALMNLASADPYHLDEVTKYVLTGVNFGVNVHVYAANLDVWNSLPADVQEALLTAGKETTALIAETMDKKTKETIDLYRERGVEVTIATPEQAQPFMEKMSPLGDIWINDMTSKGISKDQAIQALEEFRSITEKVVQN